MVTVPEFENLLVKTFGDAWQYWDSGNFKGYIASRDSNKIHAFLQNLGDTNTKFSTVQTPRRVDNHVPFMVKGFGEWLMENHYEFDGLNDLLPEQNKLEKMSFKHVKEHYWDKLKEKIRNLNLDISDEELEHWLKSLIKHVDLPEFDVKHYHHHMWLQKNYFLASILISKCGVDGGFLRFNGSKYHKTNDVIDVATNQIIIILNIFNFPPLSSLAM